MLTDERQSRSKGVLDAVSGAAIPQIMETLGGSFLAVLFGRPVWPTVWPSSRSRPLIDKCHPWNVRETLWRSSKGLWAARGGMSDQIPLRSTPRSVHFLPSAISQFFLESWPRDTSHMLIVLPPRHKKPFQENCVYLLLLHGNDSWRENKEHFGGSVLLCMNVLSRERVCVCCMTTRH